MKLLGIALLILTSQQIASFRIQARYVRVPVTVFDQKGRILDDLQRQDFQLLDDGEPTPIVNFVPDSAPIHVLLLLDSSGSLREEIHEIRRAALRFAGSFTREDRLSVVAFSDETVVLTPWTNQIRRLKRGLRKLKRGYRTAVYDALQEALHTHFSGVSGRRVIILLTDGLDNQSSAGYNQVLSTLIESQTTLYIVSRTRLVQPKVRDSDRVDYLNSVMKEVLREEGDFVDDYFKKKETAMVHLAESTGGRALFPEELDELGAHYQQVALELKHQYLLTFLPALESTKKFRPIQVTCSRTQGNVYFRKQYAWQPAD